jgi:hypothetical protein
MPRRIGFGWTCGAATALLLCTPLLILAQELPANSATLPVAAETDTAVTAEGVAGRDSAAGTVVFFRGIKMLGAWGGYTIYEGHVELGKLTSGTYFTVKLPAGEHRLIVNSWTQYPQYLSVEPGLTYYVFGTVVYMSDHPLLYESPREMFEGMKPILKDVTVKPKE